MSLRRSTRVASQSISATSPLSKLPESRKRAGDARTTTRPDKIAKNLSAPPGEDVFKRPEAPVTPIRRRKTSTKIPPLTPTPSLVRIIRAPYNSGDANGATPPPIDRPVEPHVTNATLLTPGGTQTTAYDRDGSSTKDGLPQPTATTGTLLDKACAHLIEVDGRLKPLIEKHQCTVFTPEGLAEEIDPFKSLTSGIIGQQVSGAAAKSIQNKFVALFDENKPQSLRFPTPAEVAVTDIERLRSAGLSQRKAEYIQGLAQKFVSGDLTNQMLLNASDEEVMEKLIAVRGLGKWSVEMFACFALKRLDILSTGDLGVQRGMAQFFGKDVQKLKAKGGGKWKYMSEQDMLEKSAPFSPYRSLFMWYMWRVGDVDISVMKSD